MRKLASVQRIAAIEPIENKDRIVLATVEGWKVIVRKDEFNVGDLCVYVEIDSVMPEKPEFEFLRSKKFKIKTMKMGNVYSQGICFSLNILPKGNYVEGQDVTDIIGVKKIEEYPEELDAQKEANSKNNKLRTFLFKHRSTRWLAKLIYIGTKKERCGFPTFISKTDEERIQNLPNMVNDKSPYCATEKIDGTSATYYVTRDGLFKKWGLHVCSRNLEVTNMDSFYWKIADIFDIKNFLIKLATENKCKWACIQGEIIGPGIQGNKYKRSYYDFYGFNIVLPGEYPQNPMYNRRLPTKMASEIVRKSRINWVPILYNEIILPDTVDEILEMADGISVLENRQREGIVFRSIDGKKSFKAVSNKFLVELGKSEEKNEAQNNAA